MSRASFKLLAIVAAVSFGLHLVWEVAQAPLYTCFWLDWLGCLAACLRATIGDVGLTLAVWGVGVAFTRNPAWPTVLRPIGAIGVALIGAALAIGIERHALSTGRWAYTPLMPIIPMLGVGVTPVLQMTLLLPLTYYLVGKLSRRII